MRPIDADVMKKNLLAGIADENGLYADLARQLLCAFADEQPTIDAVPVVRCKDCKHNYSKEHNKRYNLEDIVCDYWGTDGLNDDDFCSYGERSEE